MTLKFTFMERMAGLLILLAFLSVLLTVVAVGRGQNWFRQHNTYWAVYKEGYNLQPGVKVKLLRTDIGQVTEVALTEENLVKVTMRILATYSSRIRADSKAAIESPTFIGSEYISIIPGSFQEAMIPPGGQIPAIEQKKISDYVEEFELKHKLQVIEQTMEKVASLIKQLEDPTGPLMGSLSNVREVTGSIASGQGTLGRLVKEDELYGKLIAELKTLDRILAAAEVAMKSVRYITGKAAGQAKTDPAGQKDVVTQVRGILEKIERISLELEATVKDVPEISQQARQGLRDVNQILESVKKNFLIRGNLPAQPVPQSHGVEIRGN
ncbi:MAG: MlaD family protein [Thermodesulfobacteriota bacterium]